MTSIILKDILTVATAFKVGSGALLHKACQWVLAKIKAARADAAKLVADVKKDI